jgi:predicted nucleic-acid-binding protein
MTKNLVLIDANAIVSLIVDANSEKSKKVVTLLSEKECIVPIEVIAEVVYALRDKYEYTRQQISSDIKEFIKFIDELVPETNVVLYGLNLYASSRLDFVDCLLDGYAKVNGNQVFTFDDDLKKQLEHKFYHG